MSAAPFVPDWKSPDGAAAPAPAPGNMHHQSPSGEGEGEGDDVPPPSYEDVAGQSSSTAAAVAFKSGHRQHQSRDNARPGPGWLTSDSRQSSSQSLVPSTRGDDSPETRRTLLIVYIHGFYGNDQSFRSFPAHVHHFLKVALEDTHVVHSKIYPRYKTYNAIEVARDNFSAWLEPHEGPMTDVILVGHSMGGILAADVVLMPNRDPHVHQSLKHRILGHISLDCPFLGLHPGIVVSGISSLFRPAASPEPMSPSEDDSGVNPAVALSPDPSRPASPGANQQLSQVNSLDAVSQSEMSTQSLNPDPNTSKDPHFNTPFFNDKPFKERPFKYRLAHFVKKHSSEGVFGAAKNHVLSHLEFGGCLADYPALHSRYNKIRALEKVDELKSIHEPARNLIKPETRVRFINYYTMSTNSKKPDDDSEAGTPAATPIEEKPQEEHLHSEAESQELQTLDPEPMSSPRSSPPPTPGVQVESPGDSKPKEIIPPTNSDSGGERDDTPAPSTPDEPTPTATPSLEATESAQPLNLPTIPPLPEKPELADLDQFEDKDARKQADKENKRTQKAYDQAIKNRDKALKERQKLADKIRKKAEKTADKARAKEEKDKANEEKRKAKEEKERAKAERAEQKQKADENDESTEPNEAEVAAATEDLLHPEAAKDVVGPVAGQAEKAPSPSSTGAAEVEAESEDSPPLSFRDQARAETISAPMAPLPPVNPPSEPNPSTAKEAKQAAKEAAKRQKAAEKARIKEQKTRLKAEKAAAAAEAAAAAQADGSSNDKKQPKSPKERKFCVVPRKVSEGEDETWVPVRMEGVDEVGAHCGLFVPGTAHYEKLVGDVGHRVVGWVQEEMSKEAILELAAITDDLKVD